MDKEWESAQLDDYREALYLLSIINSPIIDSLIKPLQSRGQFGPRDIHKKIFEIAIPKFDKNNPLHNELATLGEMCKDKVKNWLIEGGARNYKSVGKIRSLVRELLRIELKKIDKIVRKILGGTEDA